MPYGLYISAEGAQAQSQRLDVIANNLANVDTVGFKRQLAIFQARFAEAIEQGEIQPGTGEIEDVGGGVLFRETKTDFSPGQLKRTGLPTDLAIDGDGFFLVGKGDETFLTRAGNFVVNSAGELVTPSGYHLLDENSAPVQLNLSGDAWHVTADGALQQSGAKQYLALVRPEELQRLRPEGENLFSLEQGTPLLPATRRSVQAGFLEQSGVRPVTEMMNLIEASRAYETNVKLIQNQDHMLGELVNRVLRQ